MEFQTLVAEPKVRRGLQSCLRAKEYSPGAVRGNVMGFILTTSMSDAAVYYQIRRSIRYGQLPWFTADVMIMILGFLEAILAPFCSLVQRWRLRTLTFVSLIVSATSMMLVTLPDVPLGSGSEFCSSLPTIDGIFTAVTTAGALRLTIALVMTLINMIGRSIAWNYGVVMLDQTEPGEMSLNFGILAAVRVLSLLSLPKVLDEDLALWAQPLGVFLPLLFHGFQFYRIPEPIMREDKEVEDSAGTNTTVLGSLGRLLSSGVIAGQILAMALLVTPLWSFGWHNQDIIKTLYHMTGSAAPPMVVNGADILYSYALLLAVITFGIHYKRPKIFKKVSALKLATFVSLIVTPLYCIQTLVLTCETGLVAGLSQNFTQPTCSSQCGCTAPFSEFSPVCVTDTLTTYMSPCHAGCISQDLIGGLTVYRGCGCAPGSGEQRATVGACSAVQCRDQYILHKVIVPLIAMLTVLGVQAQMVIILRTAEPRDRPLAFGLCTAVVLFLTFTCGHLGYLGIRAWTCAWSEGGRCLFHDQTFLKAMGGTSTALTGVSAIITLITWQVLRRKSKQTSEDIPMTARDSTDETESRA